MKVYGIFNKEKNELETLHFTKEKAQWNIRNWYTLFPEKGDPSNYLCVKTFVEQEEGT